VGQPLVAVDLKQRCPLLAAVVAQQRPTERIRYSASSSVPVRAAPREVEQIIRARVEGRRMWPWGHLAVAYLLSTGYVRARFDRPMGGAPVLWLAVGSQFPDLVDKPLAWYVGVLPTGRSLAHSLLVLLPVIALAYALARRYGQRESGVAFGIGGLSHVGTDALPALWNPDATATFLLWPVLSVTPYEGSPGILALFQSSLSDPYFLVELSLVAIAAGVWYRDGFPGLGTLARTSKRLG
jgi:hypothetical protein